VALAYRHSLSLDWLAFARAIGVVRFWSACSASFAEPTPYQPRPADETSRLQLSPQHGGILTAFSNPRFIREGGADHLVDVLDVEAGQLDSCDGMLAR